MQEEHNKVDRIQPQQLIDQHKHFNSQALTNNVAHLNHSGKDYFVIAIIGVQNSGKSTLLNYLFGTNFEVLHQAIGTRTTRGILVSLDKKENFIVLDVEGNDSSDRANEQEYQKMVSSFALISAHVLIINISAKTLGQYSGSQYESLKIIMEICIGQYKQEAPKTILYCVRDFNQDTDQEGEIRRKIVKDVNKIWEGLEKPEEFIKYQTTPEKFFTLEVTVMKKYNPKNTKNFEKDVEKVRNFFTNPDSDQYLFKKQKRQYNLPISDFVNLQENSWKMIIDNKKLNLPHQKEQLANYRCTDISKDIEASFLQELLQLRTKQVNFGLLVEKYANKFKTLTYNYGKVIVEAKFTLLSSFFDNEIKKSIEEVNQIWEKSLENKFQKLTELICYEETTTFDIQITNIINDLTEKYTEHFKKLNYEIPNRKQKMQKFNANLLAQKLDIMKNRSQIMISEFEKEASRMLRILCSEILRDEFDYTFWERVKTVFNVKKYQLIARHEKQVKWVRGSSLEAGELDTLEERLMKEITQNIKNQLEKTLVDRVFTYFLKKFTKDDNEIPHNFQLIQDKKLNQIFEETRQMGLNLIESINEVTLQCERRSSIIVLDFDEKQLLFEESWLSTITEQLQGKMRNQYETTIRRKKESTMKKVPWYLFIIIAFFVYDDIWFTQKEHPILHYGLTFILCAIAFIYAIGHGQFVQQGIDLLMGLFSKKIEKAREKRRAIVGKIKDSIKKNEERRRGERSDSSDASSEESPRKVNSPNN